MYPSCALQKLLKLLYITLIYNLINLLYDYSAESFHVLTSCFYRISVVVLTRSSLCNHWCLFWSSENAISGAWSWYSFTLLGCASWANLEWTTLQEVTILAVTGQRHIWDKYNTMFLNNLFCITFQYQDLMYQLKLK